MYIEKKDIRICELCLKKMKDKYRYEEVYGFKWKNRKFCLTCNKKHDENFKMYNNLDCFEGSEKHLTAYFNKLKENRRQIKEKYNITD